MKRSAVVVMAAVLMVGLFSLSILAQNQVTVDLEKLTPEQAAQILQMKKETQAQAEVKEVPTAKQVEEWADVGTKIGKAIGATCQELSVQVNDFIRTPVGKITILLIIWKIVGQQLWGIVGGTLVWVVIGSIIIWSFKFFHMKKRIRKKDSPDTFVARYDFKTDDARVASACFHVAAFVLLTIACMIIVF